METQRISLNQAALLLGVESSKVIKGQKFNWGASIFQVGDMEKDGAMIKRIAGTRQVMTDTPNNRYTDTPTESFSGTADVYSDPEIDTGIPKNSADEGDTGVVGWLAKLYEIPTEEASKDFDSLSTRHKNSLREDYGKFQATPKAPIMAEADQDTEAMGIMEKKEVFPEEVKQPRPGGPINNVQMDGQGAVDHNLYGSIGNLFNKTSYVRSEKQEAIIDKYLRKHPALTYTEALTECEKLGLIPRQDRGENMQKKKADGWDDTGEDMLEGDSNVDFLSGEELFGEEEYSLGDIVTLKSDPKKRGIFLETHELEPGDTDMLVYWMELSNPNDQEKHIVAVEPGDLVKVEDEDASEEELASAEQALAEYHSEDIKNETESAGQVDRLIHEEEELETVESNQRTKFITSLVSDVKLDPIKASIRDEYTNNPDVLEYRPFIEGYRDTIESYVLEQVPASRVAFINSNRDEVFEVVASLIEKEFEESDRNLVTSAKTSKDAQDWISKKIEYLIKNEGLTKDQAAGKAYGMARQKGYRVPKK